MSVHTEVATRIQRLSPAVINKIAAGEVIERPASVVKELLENSIDALATRIEVDVVQGGTELIRVVDDGEGIHADDVELAVTAHATSKIADADDLFRVYTLGFRGEALASIAEVSKFRIRSRPHRRSDFQSVPELEDPGARTDWKSVLPNVEPIGGVELEVEGGVAGEARLCGCPAGTQVEVRQIFFNTPVRRKFLKAAATEFAHVAEQFTRIALAHPRLHLVLRHNDRTVYELPATGQLSERLETFFGSELARHLIPVEAEQGDARLWGCVAHPGQSKATRKGQYLFLNGRWIQDRSLQHALSEAYRGLLMVGRQPIAFLFLEAPAEDVDVNVHPTKCEVRFRDPQRFYRLLLSTLRTKFLTLDLHSALNVPRSGALMGDKPAVDPERQLQAQQELVTWAKEQLANWQPKDDLSDLEAKLAACEVEESWSPLATPRQDPTPLRPAPALAETSGPQHSGSAGPIVHATTPSAATRPVSASAELRAMQVHDCYLVVETGDGLTVIDQHALHERILYEHLRRRVLAGSVEVQKLLMPVTVELTAREAGLLLDRADVLAELGLSVAPFGGQTVALEAYPTLLARADPADLLRSIVEHLETSSQEIGRHDLLDGLLHMMACKAAIKAGQRLAPEEIATLIAQRHLVDDHHHCPHGRPTALTLSRAELDRQFGRLG